MILREGLLQKGEPMTLIACEQRVKVIQMASMMSEKMKEWRSGQKYTSLYSDANGVRYTLIVMDSEFKVVLE